MRAQTLPNAVPAPQPETQWFGSNGRPLAGGKLCAYAAGTSTPLATYTDSTAGTPNTNPVILDVGGRASVWIGPQLYKFVLRSGGDSTCTTGNVEWTQDNVSDTTLYFVNYVKNVGTATLITYTAPFTGAISRTVSSRLSERVSVKDYGATGNGATDDSTAIQAALTQVCTGGAGTGLYFPAGRYNIGTQLTCTITGGLQGVHIYGDGPQSTLNSTGTNGILQITGSDGVSQDRVFLENLQLTGVSNTAFGLKMIGVAGYGLSNINSDTIAKGIWFVATQQGYIKGGVHLNTVKGIVLDGHISVPLGYWIGSNAADISGVTLQPAGAGACWEISGAADLFIHGNHCTTATIGAHFVSAAATVNVGNIILDSNHFEVNATAAIQIDSGFVGVMVTISNSSFFNAGNELLLDGTVSTRVLNNAFNGNVAMTTCFNVCQFIGNKIFAGTFTDTTGNVMQYNNHFDAHPINHTTFWKDPAEWRFPSDSIVAPGDAAIFTGNPLVSGNWGINVPGVGTAANYAYLLLHDFMLRGSLGGDSLILTSTGGQSAKFTPGQTTINGQILGVARLLSLGAAGSPIARIGFNRDTQSGGNYNASGNAFELDAGDVTDSFVINRYNHAGTLVGIDFESDINRDTILPRKVDVGAVTFSGLSTGLSIAGTFVYCTDCNIASPCTSGGSGAWAFRSGATWKCPF